MRIEVRNNNLERAIKILKRKLADDGMFKELQTRMAYEKPSEKRNRKKRAAIARQARSDRERAEVLNG